MVSGASKAEAVAAAIGGGDPVSLPPREPPAATPRSGYWTKAPRRGFLTARSSWRLQPLLRSALASPFMVSKMPRCTKSLSSPER